MEIFPVVTGSNLLGNEIEIPMELHGSLNILVIAYQRWQQSLVDSWVPYLKKLTNEIPDVDYYELPTIRRMNWLSRSFINNGMKAGIPSGDTRGRTITLYIDKEEFNRALDVTSEDTIHIFLVDLKGQIHWRGEGSFNEQIAMQLKQAIEEELAHRENEKSLSLSDSNNGESQN
ncbi:MAG: hypothetical protein JSW61_14955 [Candidatus Thorarchaeota archaeon]|nr:MAG: hypothetical protein JSW61_14955 [Candidatus Thorarchaeota archaeon]